MQVFHPFTVHISDLGMDEITAWWKRLQTWKDNTENSKSYLDLPFLKTLTTQASSLITNIQIPAWYICKNSASWTPWNNYWHIPIRYAPNKRMLTIWCQIVAPARIDAPPGILGTQKCLWKPLVLMKSTKVCTGWSETSQYTLYQISSQPMVITTSFMFLNLAYFEERFKHDSNTFSFQQCIQK